MSKFTFVCEESYGVPAKRTVEFEADSLDQILNEFEMFLRGSGFYFRGTLDIVDEEDMFFQTDEPEKQNFDFLSIPQNNWPFKDQNEEYKIEMPGTIGGAKVTFASEK